MVERQLDLWQPIERKFDRQRPVDRITQRNDTRRRIIDVELHVHRRRI